MIDRELQWILTREGVVLVVLGVGVGLLASSNWREYLDTRALRTRGIAAEAVVTRVFDSPSSEPGDLHISYRYRVGAAWFEEDAETEQAVVSQSGT